MNRLVLARHGETPWNAQGRLQGQQDIPLAGSGLEQVRDLAPVVARLGPDRVVCSPLLRCRQTAAALDLDVDVVDDRWQEADLGQWTGSTRAELVGRGDGGYARWRLGEHSPPGGESLDDLEARVAQALRTLVADPSGTVLVVTHGGPIRAAVQRLLGLPRGRVVPVGPASLTAFDLTNGSARLITYNLRPATAAAAAIGGPAPAGPESDTPD